MMNAMFKTVGGESGVMISKNTQVAIEPAAITMVGTDKFVSHGGIGPVDGMGSVRSRCFFFANQATTAA